MGTVLGAVSDLVCQFAVEEATVLDRRRLVAMTVFGGIYNGGAVTFIYRSYPRLLQFLPAAVRATPTRSAFGAAVIDQTLHCPLIYTPAFYLCTGVLQGQSIASAAAELRSRYFDSTVACMSFWFPFMFFNFRVVPPHLNVACMQTGNLIWSVIIDYIAHR